MKKVLLLDTSVGSLNQGDDIINLSIKNNWKSLFNKNYIMRLATHTPMYTLLQSSIYADKLRVFKEADYKFLCGTNALYTNMLRPLPSWNINILDYALAKNTICLGVGIGVNSDNVNWYTKKLYNMVLSHKYIHSVRDEKTKEFLESLGFKAANTGCPTLWGLTPDHCSMISNKKGKKVVFTLTYYEKDEKKDKEMINILLRNYEEVYFWAQCIKDLDYFKVLTSDKTIKVISPNIDAYDILLSKQSVDYVGSRLHGGIFALQHKCRAIIISIDYRAREMSKNFSLPVIERDDIRFELESRINTSFETQITGLDFELIENWKKQFSFE